MPYPAKAVPAHDLLTLIRLSFPAWTIESILIISLPILIKSPPKNDVIPANSILSSVVKTWPAVWLVIAVDTIGDWIILSKEMRAFLFWLTALKQWEVPIPTLVISTTSGTVWSAWEIFSASLMGSSSILTAYTVLGYKVVVPIPANPVVIAIPSAVE